MTEMPAEMTELEHGTSIAEHEPSVLRLSPRRLFTLAAVVVAGFAILLDAFEVHAFGVAGPSNSLVVLGAAAVTLLGFSATMSR